jgi:DnaJ-class molecular chaperone
MTVEEAREILGVQAVATREEIKAAYFRLMSKVHPDHGGTNHFAKELNAAKAVLMGE